MTATTRLIESAQPTRTLSGGRLTQILILGAAGRDFHNFNVVSRDDPMVRMVVFTQAQIPRLSDRCYPASLARPARSGGHSDRG